MDNNNYMDDVLQTFLLIQSSPDELQVGMVDSFLNNQVSLRGWVFKFTNSLAIKNNVQMVENSTGKSLVESSNTNMTTFQALQLLQIPDHSSALWD